MNASITMASPVCQLFLLQWGHEAASKDWGRNLTSHLGFFFEVALHAAV